jgi:hypothetical protein
LRRLHLHVADFMSGTDPGDLDPKTMLWSGTYPMTWVVGFLSAALVLIGVSTVITTRQDL